MGWDILEGMWRRQCRFQGGYDGARVRFREPKVQVRDLRQVDCELSVYNSSVL